MIMATDKAHENQIHACRIIQTWFRKRCILAYYQYHHREYETQNDAAFQIQRYTKTYTYRKRFLRYRWAVNVIKCHLKGGSMKVEIDGVELSSVEEGWLARIRYNRIRRGLKLLQALSKGYCVNKRIEVFVRGIIKIQRLFRRHYAFQSRRKLFFILITSIQACVRGFLFRRQIDNAQLIIQLQSKKTARTYLKAILKIQATWKAKFIRSWYVQIILAIYKIQHWFRSGLYRIKFLQLRRVVLWLQCHTRRMLAIQYTEKLRTAMHVEQEKLKLSRWREWELQRAAPSSTSSSSSVNNISDRTLGDNSSSKRSNMSSSKSVSNHHPPNSSESRKSRGMSKSLSSSEDIKSVSAPIVMSSSGTVRESGDCLSSKCYISQLLSFTISADISESYPDGWLHTMIRFNQYLHSEHNLSILTFDLGKNHTIVVDNDNNLYSFGAGDRGQLGHPHRRNIHFPTRIEAMNRHVATAEKSKTKQHSGMSRKSYHTTTSTSTTTSEKHNIFSTSISNSSGSSRLEREMTIMSLSHQTRINSNIRILTICCGNEHTLVLLESHRIYSWGSNSRGQLGHSDFATSILPRLVDHTSFANKTVIQIACGAYHSVCISEPFHVYTWGARELIPSRMMMATADNNSSNNNNSNNINTATTLSSNTNNHHTSHHNSTSSSSTSSSLFPTDSSIPISLSFLNHAKIHKVVCGASHTLALSSVKGVLTWGRNTHSQLGIVKQNNNNNNNNFYTSNESTRSSGDSSYNSACVGEGDVVVVQIPVDNDDEAALYQKNNSNRNYSVHKNNSSNSSSGSNKLRQSQSPSTLQKQQQQQQQYLSFPLDGEYENAATDIFTGGYHNLFLHRGRLWCWGGNTCGQVGNGTVIDVDVPTRVVFNNIIPSTGCRNNNNSESTWSTYNNVNNKPRLSSSSSTSTSSTVLVKAVYSGWQHTTVLTECSRVYAWGAVDLVPHSSSGSRHGHSETKTNRTKSHDNNNKQMNQSSSTSSSTNKTKRTSTKAVDSTVVGIKPSSPPFNAVLELIRNHRDTLPQKFLTRASAAMIKNTTHNNNHQNSDTSIANKKINSESADESGCDTTVYCTHPQLVAIPTIVEITKPNNNTNTTNSEITPKYKGKTNNNINHHCNNDSASTTWSHEYDDDSQSQSQQFQPQLPHSLFSTYSSSMSILTINKLLQFDPLPQQVNNGHIDDNTNVNNITNTVQDDNKVSAAAINVSTNNQPVQANVYRNNKIHKNNQRLSVLNNNVSSESHSSFSLLSLSKSTILKCQQEESSRNKNDEILRRFRCELVQPTSSSSSSSSIYHNSSNSNRNNNNTDNQLLSTSEINVVRDDDVSVQQQNSLTISVNERYTMSRHAYTTPIANTSSYTTPSSGSKKKTHAPHPSKSLTTAPVVINNTQNNNNNSNVLNSTTSGGAVTGTDSLGLPQAERSTLLRLARRDRERLFARVTTTTPTGSTVDQIQQQQQQRRQSMRRSIIITAASDDDSINGGTNNDRLLSSPAVNDKETPNNKKDIKMISTSREDDITPILAPASSSSSTVTDSIIKPPSSAMYCWQFNHQALPSSRELLAFDDNDKPLL